MSKCDYCKNERDTSHQWEIHEFDGNDMDHKYFCSLKCFDNYKEEKRKNE